MRARTLIRRPTLVRRRSMQAPPLSLTTVRYVVDVDRHRILGSTPLTYMSSARSGSVRSSRIRKHIFPHRKSNSSTFRALVAQLGLLSSLEMANTLRKCSKNEWPHSKVGLQLSQLLAVRQPNSWLSAPSQGQEITLCPLRTSMVG